MLLEEININIIFYRNAINDLINLDSIRNRSRLETATHINIFEQLVSNAMITSIYSLLEGAILKLCDKYQGVYKYRVELKDITGNGIDKMVNYLEKVVGLTSIKSKNWNVISNWKEVRNCIVHNNGITRRGKEDAIKKVAKLEYDEALDIKIIILTFEDCLNFLEEASEYIKYVYSLKN